MNTYTQSTREHVHILPEFLLNKFHNFTSIPNLCHCWRNDGTAMFFDIRSEYGNPCAWLWVASTRVVMNIQIAHQGHYLRHILLVIQESLVNTSCTRCMLQCRPNKHLFDEANSEGSIRKRVNKEEWGMEYIKCILDHNNDQAMLPAKRQLVRVWWEYQIWLIHCYCSQCGRYGTCHDQRQ